jgi:CMP-N,N'-diacetyllegionaminic acid synthase
MTLYIIPARGGSKGVPGKNIKALGAKPLIYYTIETARQLAPDDNICLSTDSMEIKEAVERTGLTVPFLRPAELATDTAGSYEVLLHALDYYETQGRVFDRVMLLQPTSPFRKLGDLKKMEAEMDSHPGTEMVVSVGESFHNPYFSLFEENKEGWLSKSKPGNFARRQDCPPVYYYNGSAYLINTGALKSRRLSEMERVRKFVMEEKYCQDIDTPLDWLICEALLEKGIYKDADS